MCRMSSVYNRVAQARRPFSLFSTRGEKAPLAVGVAQIYECNNNKLQLVMKYQKGSTQLLHRSH